MSIGSLENVVDPAGEQARAGQEGRWIVRWMKRKMDSPLDEVARPDCFASPALRPGLHQGHLVSARPQLKGCLAHVR